MRRGATARGWRVATAIASAAGFVFALAAGILANRVAKVEQRDSARLAALESEARHLSRVLSDRDRQVVSLRNELATRGQLMRAVLAPDLRTIKLGPLKPAPDAAALVAVSESRGQAVLQVAGLPQPPAGKQYELWWIGARSGPVRAAVFSPGANGAATIASASPPQEQILASAVTLEPAGGVDKPTGAMYLKGAP
jgi:anti-sigma-K factor RskA